MQWERRRDSQQGQQRERRIRESEGEPRAGLPVEQVATRQLHEVLAPPLAPQ